MSAGSGPAKDGPAKDGPAKDGPARGTPAKGGPARGGGKAARAGGSTASAKIRAQRAEQARRRRRRGFLIGAGAAAVTAAVAVTVALATGGSSAAGARLASLSTLGTLQPAPAPGAAGPEGVAVPAAAPLAGPAATVTGQTIDGIGCQATEQTLFHIHAHLTIFVNGQARQVPAGVGIPGATGSQTPGGPFVSSGTCLYWLHTHAADGIIHIESPVQRTFTLGDFFREWGQPLSAGQAGPARGHVTAIVNGQVYLGDPGTIPLTAHAQIQLEVGTPLIAPETTTFPNGL